MRPLTKAKQIKAHGLVWTYYKTSTGLWRYITPKTFKDSGPFPTLRALTYYIKAMGGNINWQ